MSPRLYPLRRTGRALSPALALALALLASASVEAQTGVRSAPVDRPDRTPAQWLQAIQTAAERLTYAGTIVMQRGSMVQSSRLIHVFDGGVSQERLQVLDGRQREYLRRGADVDCLYPETRTIRRERRAEQEAFPAVGAGAPGEILMRYRLRVGGIERVAGVECRVLSLEPLDALRYGHWLCAERNTGLLLKAKTLDAEQRPMEQLAFTDLRIGDRVDRNQLRSPWVTDGWRVEPADIVMGEPETPEWQVGPVPGFRQLRAVTRRMSDGEATRSALQFVLSDGLATLSVFVEPAADDGVQVEASQVQGTLSAYSRRAGDVLVTAIGEVPLATVRQAVLGVAQVSTPAASAAERAQTAPVSRAQATGSNPGSGRRPTLIESAAPRSDGRSVEGGARAPSQQR
ncbi:MAG: MucB/RseB C-terminal domain-containing protein [Betaproteobacteria bacterium]|jgi:sigma-E factor negative regulatory protein RseB